MIPSIDPKPGGALSDGQNPAAAKPPTSAEKPVRFAGVRDSLLSTIAMASQDDNRNRSKPFCERVSAQTAADCGDVASARAELAHLPQAKSELFFYRVPPLVSLAWQHLKADQAHEAEQALDEALAAARELPTVGRPSTETAADLAAALVAIGHDAEARKLIDRFPAAGHPGKLAAVTGTAVAWGGWDLELAARERPLLDVASLPKESIQGPIVVELAVARGYPAQALRLIQGVSSLAVARECLIVWGEAAERLRLDRRPIDARVRAADGANALPSPDSVGQKLDFASRARLQARIGLVRLRAKDSAGSETALRAAVAALGPVTQAPEFVFPSLKELVSLKPQEASASRSSALALTEISRLSGALNHHDEARRHLLAAMAALRSSAPSPLAVQERLDDLRRNFVGRRNELRTALKVKTNDEARVAVNQYRDNLNHLLAEAEARFALQQEVLSSAIAWEDAAELWEQIQKRAVDSDVQRREPYFNGPLPSRLARKLEESGNKELAVKIRQASATNAPSPSAALEALTDRVGEGDLSRLVKAMDAVNAEKSERDWAAFIGADRLVHAGRLSEGLQFVRMFDDPLVREEGLQWTAALGCRIGQVRATYETLHAANLTPTELVSAWRGFLLGLMSYERAQPPTSSADPAAKPPAAGAKL